MEDETCDIINQMFAYNLDKIVQIVFLFLDPVSLKDAQCVSHQWNQFIKNRLWGSRVARKTLMSRLWYWWRNESNVNMKDLANSKRDIHSLSCDEKFVYCGTNEGFIEVYCLTTGQCVHELDCNPIGISGVEFDVGEAVIATVTGDVNFCVWDKINGKKLYEDEQYFSTYALAIKVISRGAVLIGADDGSLYLFMAHQDNEWSLVNKYSDLTEEISNIDSDGDWVVTGTLSTVYLWSFTNKSLVLDPRNVKVEFEMLTFSFPFIFVVGGGFWAGLQVWNIVSREMVRHIDFNGWKYDYIKSIEGFLTINEFYRDKSFFVFDKKELCDPKVSNDKIWIIEKRISETNKRMNLATINKTSILVSSNYSIFVQNY